MSDETIRQLIERITAYLSSGGLFNPELANHYAVRDLLIDCRNCLSSRPEPSAATMSGDRWPGDPLPRPEPQAVSGAEFPGLAHDLRAPQAVSGKR